MLPDFEIGSRHRWLTKLFRLAVAIEWQAYFEFEWLLSAARTVR